MSDSGNERTFEGRCHCGAIGFSFRTAQTPDRWPVRACQCRFCLSHGARTTSDRHGSVIFHIVNPAKLHRYRFASRTADFLVCRDCGTYVAAVVASPRGQFATLNVNAIAGIAGLPEANPVSYEGESAEQKRARREGRETSGAHASGFRQYCSRRRMGHTRGSRPTLPCVGCGRWQRPPRTSQS